MIYDEKGRISPKPMANQYEALRDNPETTGMFKRIGLDVMVVRAPPWDRNEGVWHDRVLTDDDIYRAMIWLENKGLTPKKAMVRSLIYTIADENC